MTGEPDLEALRALALVAEESSISAVGARIGVSQQAVSQRLRRLEEELGVRLIARSALGARLTPAGELVVGWARPLLDAADEFSDAVVALRADRRRTLQIAASLTTAEHLVPEWIARWSSGGEGRPVARLMVDNSTQVVAALRGGTAELGVIETPSVPTDLGSVTVAHDTIELVVGPAHPWARTGRVSARELAATPLVLRESGSGTRQALEDALAAAGSPLEAEPAAVVSTTLGVRSAVMTGVAPGALSALAVADDLRAGRLVRVRIRGLEIVRPLTAIWAGRTPPRDVRDFLEVAAQVA